MDNEIVRAANAKKGSPFLNTDQAAHYVGLSRRTLEKMRTAGGGPRFRKHGRYVRYHIDDLDEWSADRVKISIDQQLLEQRSTRSYVLNRIVYGSSTIEAFKAVLVQPKRVWSAALHINESVRRFPIQNFALPAERNTMQFQPVIE